jgi:hypothetical protein
MLKQGTFGMKIVIKVGTQAILSNDGTVLESTMQTLV